MPRKEKRMLLAIIHLLALIAIIVLGLLAACVAQLTDIAGLGLRA